ncbi:centromere protein T-like [Mustela nigripes]|uniref:centromere protein T-like n=1 Tax=Mustela nigripes TaxID=77151 RepID=UPI00281643CB|nr:centromere protein T-like [Mustela nigripes]
MAWGRGDRTVERGRHRAAAQPRPQLQPQQPPGRGDGGPRLAVGGREPVTPGRRAGTHRAEGLSARPKPGHPDSGISILTPAVLESPAAINSQLLHLSTQVTAGDMQRVEGNTGGIGNAEHSEGLPGYT